MEAAGNFHPERVSRPRVDVRAIPAPLRLADGRCAASRPYGQIELSNSGRLAGRAKLRAQARIATFFAHWSARTRLLDKGFFRTMARIGALHRARAQRRYPRLF